MYADNNMLLPNTEGSEVEEPNEALLSTIRYDLSHFHLTSIMPSSKSASFANLLFGHRQLKRSQAIGSAG